MFETLKRLYLAGAIEEEGLTRAVALSWITMEQKKDILEGA